MIFLDFETFTTDKYHLDSKRSSGMTTEDYVRDAQFQATMLSFCENNGEPQSAAGPDAIAEMLAARDWSHETVVMHNAQFDAAIMSFVYGIVPGSIIDTLAVARGTFGLTENISLGDLAERFGLPKKSVPYEELKGVRFENMPAELVTELAGLKPEMPVQKRYLTSDTTYEKLGVLMSENPGGVLVHRDEMIYLLRGLDKEEQVNARSFFITAWNGSSGYTFDRIQRGTVYIDRVILSMIGAATPSGIIKYIKGVEDDGFGGDGLFQRFSLAIWPDITPNWSNIDTEPNREARDKAYELFKKFDTLVPSAVGAEYSLFEPTPFLRLDEEAETAFVAWRTELEHRLRAPDGMQYMLEGHISKYRKLVPVLALINHLAEDGAHGLISGRAMSWALLFVKYLESHAKRIYGCRKATNADAAKAILDRIKHHWLDDGFKQREIIHDHSWAGLKEEDVVVEGLKLLCATGWIKPETIPPGPQGGRPSIIFRVSPACYR